MADGSSLRVAILGSGAVGGLYGGLLAKSGVDVHFLLHSDFDHVAQHGLTIESVLGDFHLPSPSIYASADALPVCDVVIIALKTTLNATLDRVLPRLVGDRGVALTLQNGLDVEADLCRSVPADRVLGGCCFLCSNKLGPGWIKHLDYGRIVFGAYRPAAAGQPPTPAESVGQQILAAMNDAGIDARWTGDLAAARWRKLMWNIPFNGLSVVLDASTDQIIGCPMGKRLAQQLIDEVHSGATACGVVVDPHAKWETMHHTETMVPYDSSMRLDDRHGREMEVEAIFGNPLRAVAEHGDVMPRVSTLYHLLAYRNERRHGR